MLLGVATCALAVRYAGLNPGYTSWIHFLDTLKEVLLKKPIEAVIAFFVLPAVYWLSRGTYSAFRAKRLARGALDAVARSMVDGVQREGHGFWLKAPLRQPQGYRSNLRGSIPILVIATLKGGVGKTTLTANLGAYFAAQWVQQREVPGQSKPVRVLLIDGDFQGSLSTMTVSGDARFAQPSKASILVGGELVDGSLVHTAAPLNRPGMRSSLKIHTIPA